MKKKIRYKVIEQFKIEDESLINYKNPSFLERFLNDRGKILSKRLTGITSKQQRKVTEAIKLARFLALLPTGGIK